MKGLFIIFIYLFLKPLSQFILIINDQSRVNLNVAQT